MDLDKICHPLFVSDANRYWEQVWEKPWASGLFIIFLFGVQIDIGTTALLLTLEHPQADLGQLIKRMIIHDLAAGL